jgi:trans-aconitate methyltransferase
VNAEVLEALYQLLSRLEARWLPPVPDNSVFHAYDPLPLAIFLEGLAVVEQHATGRRFLDVGCGMGTKLALMHYLGWTVAGIDRHRPYVDVAREFVPEATVTCADAHDLPSFDADVVYAYRPCVSDEHEDSLERHLLARMKRGSLLWLPTRVLGTEMPAERLGVDVWVA